MPRGHGHRRQRRRIFVGCEGESEIGYSAFIGHLAEEAGCAVHLDIRKCRGGDPLAIVETAVRELHARVNRRGAFEAQMIFLDADRRSDAPARTANADRLLSQHRFHAIWSVPTLEALLLKHFRGHQRSKPATSALALRQLQGCWPEYHKGMTAQELRNKLDSAAVARAAAVVPALRRFLDTINLEL